MVDHGVAEVAVFGELAKICAEAGDQAREYYFSESCALLGLLLDAEHFVSVVIRLDVEFGSNMGDFLDKFLNLGEGFEVKIVVVDPRAKFSIFVSVLYLAVVVAFIPQLLVLLENVQKKEEVALFVTEFVEYVLFIFISLLFLNGEQVGKIDRQSQDGDYGTT